MLNSQNTKRRKLTDEKNATHFTPCRRIGLNRKRKVANQSPPQNISQNDEIIHSQNPVKLIKDDGVVSKQKLIVSIDISKINLEALKRFETNNTSTSEDLKTCVIENSETSVKIHDEKQNKVTVAKNLSREKINAVYDDQKIGSAEIENKNSEIHDEMKTISSEKSIKNERLEKQKKVSVEKDLKAKLLEENNDEVDSIKGSEIVKIHDKKSVTNEGFEKVNKRKKLSAEKEVDLIGENESKPFETSVKIHDEMKTISNEKSVTNEDFEKVNKRKKLSTEKEVDLIGENESKPFETSVKIHNEMKTISNEKTKVKNRKKELKKQHLEEYKAEESDGGDFVDVKKRKRRRQMLRISKRKHSPACTGRTSSDSENDFVLPPAKVPEQKLKKMIAPTVDDFNKTDHIRIAENKSYTIIHKDNIVSYVRWFDSDVSFKVTESDDNQSTTTATRSFEPRKSMIIERRDYLPTAAAAAAKSFDPTCAALLEMPSMFDEIMRKLDEKHDETNDGLDDEPSKVSVEIDSVKINDELHTISSEKPLTNEGYDKQNKVTVENRDSETSVTVYDTISSEKSVTNDCFEKQNKVTVEKEIASKKSVKINDELHTISSAKPNEGKRKKVSVELKASKNEGFEKENKRNKGSVEKENTDSESVYDELIRASEKRKKVPVAKEIDDSETSVKVHDESNTISTGNPVTVEIAANETSVVQKLKEQVALLQERVRRKQEQKETLERMSVYRESHNVDELQSLTLRYKRGAQEALIDLLFLLKQHSETQFGMPSLLSYLKVSNRLIGYNQEEDRFM